MPPLRTTSVPADSLTNAINVGGDAKVAAACAIPRLFTQAMVFVFAFEKYHPDPEPYKLEGKTSYGEYNAVDDTGPPAIKVPELTPVPATVLLVPLGNT